MAAWWQTASTPRRAAPHRIEISDVAANELRLGPQVVRNASVCGWQDGVEQSDVMARVQQRVDDVRADEAGPAGDENHVGTLRELGAEITTAGGLFRDS